MINICEKRLPPVINITNFSEAFDALDDLYSEDLSEAYYDNAHFVTDYNNYKIYSYSVANEPGHKDDKGIPDPYRTEYYFEGEKGSRCSGFHSIESCKKGIDADIAEHDYNAKEAEAEKLIGTTALSYRGFEILYKSVIDATAKPCVYNYEILTTSKNRWVGPELEDKAYKSIDLAKSAIDSCIDEYNSYAEDNTRYNESIRRLIKEALARLV